MRTATEEMMTTIFLNKMEGIVMLVEVNMEGTI